MTAKQESDKLDHNCTCVGSYNYEKCDSVDAQQKRNARYGLILLAIAVVIGMVIILILQHLRWVW